MLSAIPSLRLICCHSGCYLTADGCYSVCYKKSVNEEAPESNRCVFEL